MGRKISLQVANLYAKFNFLLWDGISGSRRYLLGSSQSATAEPIHGILDGDRGHEKAVAYSSTDWDIKFRVSLIRPNNTFPAWEREHW
jgi:hypothetical protein